MRLSFQHASLLLLAPKVLVEAVSVDVNIIMPAISTSLQLYNNGEVACFAPFPGRTQPPPRINPSSCLPGKRHITQSLCRQLHGLGRYRREIPLKRYVLLHISLVQASSRRTQ